MFFQDGKIVKILLIMIAAAAVLVVLPFAATAAENNHTAVWVSGDNLQGFFSGAGSSEGVSVSSAMGEVSSGVSSEVFSTGEVSAGAVVFSATGDAAGVGTSFP